MTEVASPNYLPRLENSVFVIQNFLERVKVVFKGGHKFETYIKTIKLFADYHSGGLVFL